MTRNKQSIVSSSVPPALALFLFMSAGVIAQSADKSPFTAENATVIRGAGRFELNMPTDVAVGEDGSIYVADGVNDRIVVFGSDGTYHNDISSVAGVSLSHPVGIDFDTDGQLWIADSGNHRVIARMADGSLADTIVAPADGAARPMDPTDVAVSVDGNTLWIVDNDNHRVIRYDLKSRSFVSIGGFGESLGQLNHPFMAAVGAGGVYVTDVINGRLSVFDLAGRTQTPVSGYGIEPGDLYRPKGVAIDGVGNIWISDSVMGVVQVFGKSGGFLDVLRDKSGEPFRFASPIGMAIKGDELFVAELAANQVRRVKIGRGPQKPERAPAPRKMAITGQQGRGCTVCHTEWVPPLDSGGSTEVMPAIKEIAGLPYVSRAENCLSCHDGSIVDSRRRVWLEHGHRTGVAPPPGVKVPDVLPLVNGQIMCRTCHSAHMSGQFTGDLKTSVFLRVENSASQLCISCHGDHTRKENLGTHPTGGMPWPIPQELVDAGAKVGPNGREITCQVCHTPHGSANDHLLVMGVTSNQLCLTCHAKMRPGMFRDGGNTEHPISPLVNAEQKASIERMGTRIGPEDHLICLSCHKLHHGKSERFMLAEELTDGKMCISCHSEKTQIVGTMHDLRTNHPDERNRLGMTAESGGPCSACHMFHRYARAPEPSPSDALGQCITCHQDGRCAGNRPLMNATHPGNHCTDCHNPHETKYTSFLKARTSQVCMNCHSEQSPVLGGAHDVTLASSKWPAASQNGDTCMACHRPHADNAAELFRMPATASADIPAKDAACIACHESASRHANGNLAAVHPAVISDPARAGRLPLVAAADGSRQIGCTTCHNPHGHRVNLMRVAESEPAAAVCFQCHSNMEPVLLTSHGMIGSKAGASSALDRNACTSCHSLHSMPTLLANHLLTRPAAPVSAVADGWMTGLDPSCVSCHREGGESPAPRIASHPDVPMMVLGLQPGGEATSDKLPLFDEHGAVDPRGRITCRTCHTPHGQEAGKGELAAVKEMEPKDRKAARMLLRSFEPPNVCTTCHGADGLWRFLYYHDPDRRSGPPASGATASAAK